jgi:hypothetical protein
MKQFKGGQRSVEYQYFAEPQPSFGIDPLYKNSQIGLEAYYQLYNNVSFKFSHCRNAQVPFLQMGSSYTISSLGFIWSAF